MLVTMGEYIGRLDWLDVLNVGVLDSGTLPGTNSLWYSKILQILYTLNSGLEWQFMVMYHTHPEKLLDETLIHTAPVPVRRLKRLELTDFGLKDSSPITEIFHRNRTVV